jgi:alpha-L-arabinofuranosidase
LTGGQEETGAELIGSLDGQVVETLREEGAPSLASSAGVDTLRRELVLKLANKAERERTLQLRGLPLSRQWKGEILTADSLTAENTLDHPNLVAPRPWPVRAGTSVTLPARSLVVVRIPLTPPELRPVLSQWGRFNSMNWDWQKLGFQKGCMGCWTLQLGCQCR